MSRLSPQGRRRLADAIARTDFYSFLSAAFPLVAQADVFLPNWHIEAIAFALERVMKGEIKRLIITLPPRSLKSICASVAYPSFVLGHDPTRCIICVSYSDSLARKHANDCRALMRTGLYRGVFPGTRISAAKDTELEMMTTRRGFRLATSVGGTLTGRQPHHHRRSAQAPGRAFGVGACCPEAVVCQHVADEARQQD